jgi:hypothetical protein
MVHLYLDNFRGFSRTVIPFASVNFLVGENSTGKSSVLGLINLLSSIDFWFTQNFNMAGHEFGGFRDILSATAPHGTEFSFGIYTNGPGTQDKSSKPFCCLASYTERDALPTLSFFARALGNDFLAVKKTRKSWKYKTAKLSTENKARNPSEIFESFEAEHLRDQTGYTDTPKGFPSGANVMHVLGMLGNLAATGKPNLHNFIFPVPLPTPEGLAWLAPIRTKPKRTYDGYGVSFNPEGEHTPYLLQKKLAPLTKTVKPFRAALEAFGKKSGLFSGVEIHKLGKDATAPFELLVRLVPSCPLRIDSVGYGVSQALPVIVEMLVRRKGSYFAIQQPEVHLHPRAQSALGDMIFQMAETEGKHFFVETHSDFTIDRFRMNFKKTPSHKTTAQVLFFERVPEGNRVHVLPLKKNGEYPEDQPAAFRDFFLKEQMDLLGL